MAGYLLPLTSKIQGKVERKEGHHYHIFLWIGSISLLCDLKASQRLFFFNRTWPEQLVLTSLFFFPGMQKQGSAIS